MFDTVLNTTSDGEDSPFVQFWNTVLKWTPDLGPGA